MTLPATYGFPEASGVALASPPWFFPQFITEPVGDGASHAKVLSFATDVPALWQADTFTADQYSQLTVASSPTGAAQEYVALILRSPLTASAHMPDCYVFYCDGVSDTEIDYYSGGSSTVIAGPVSVAYTPGDVFKFEVVGTTLTAYKNGSSILSTTDSTYSTGYPGIDFYSVGGVIRAGSFEADNASGGSPGVHTVSGTGSFTVSSPAWLSTAITGRPGQIVSGNANPPNWYHVGMLSWGTVNGAMVAYPITRDLDLVELPAGLDTVWYEFIGGVTAVITELGSP